MGGGHLSCERSHTLTSRRSPPSLGGLFHYLCWLEVPTVQGIKGSVASRKYHPCPLVIFQSACSVARNHHFYFWSCGSITDRESGAGRQALTRNSKKTTVAVCPLKDRNSGTNRLRNSGKVVHLRHHVRDGPLALVGEPLAALPNDFNIVTP